MPKQRKVLGEFVTIWLVISFLADETRDRLASEEHKRSWNFLAGRLPSGAQQFSLDGQCFLEAFPPLVTKEIEFPWKVRLFTKQDYRYLGPAADK